jgi:hypothetical protein
LAYFPLYIVVESCSEQTTAAILRLRHTRVTPAPVLEGKFPPIHRKIPCKYGSIHCGIFLDLTEICSAKTASHLSAGNFRGIFAADDDALLTQGEEEKGKSTEKGRRQAVQDRLSYAYTTKNPHQLCTIRIV